jgi:hypothetical protein
MPPWAGVIGFCDYRYPTVEGWIIARRRDYFQTQISHSLNDLSRDPREDGAVRADKLGATTAPDRKRLEAKLIEHLEAAQAITDELGPDQTGPGRSPRYPLASHRSEC